MLKKNHIFGYIEKTYLMQACYPNFVEASNHIEKENTIIWSIVKMYTGTPLEPGVAYVTYSIPTSNHHSQLKQNERSI